MQDGHIIPFSVDFLSGEPEPAAMMTREHVVWAAAIWVEKHFGAQGPGFIAERIDTLMLEDDIVGVEMWLKISDRYAALGSRELALS